MIRALSVGALLAAATPAQAQAANYLIESTLSAAVLRSNAGCQALGCGDAGHVTQYWWEIVGEPGSLNGWTPPDATSAAIVLFASGPYGDQGLSAAEKTAEKTAAQLTAAGWSSAGTVQNLQATTP